MNKTVIEVGALVFGLLMLIGLYLAYTKTGQGLVNDIMTKIHAFWYNNPDGNNANPSQHITILPSNLTEAKVLFATL